MWYWLLILLLALIVAAMLLRLRFRFELCGSQKRLFFLGLGRSGADLDFVHKRGRLKLFGLAISSFSMKRDRSKAPRKKTKKEVSPPKPGRRRSILDMLRLFPQTAHALWTYIISLLGASVVEELDGEIRAGFEEPDLTGMTFGYYQAALAAVPSVMSRINYEPDWTGASFTGSMRVAVGIPLYKLTWRTMVLLFQLPLRKLTRVAIGQKRGDQDGQQRS